jgi:hypothetical protein
MPVFAARRLLGFPVSRGRRFGVQDYAGIRVTNPFR